MTSSAKHADAISTSDVDQNGRFTPRDWPCASRAADQPGSASLQQRAVSFTFDVSVSFQGQNTLNASRASASCPAVRSRSATACCARSSARRAAFSAAAK